MVNRIFAFIELQQLTPTEFADRIGVSRASISSIKTGRTQPTLPLVEKIKQHYPDIDIEWLIFGKGDAPIVNKQQDEIAISHDELKQEIEEEVVVDSSNNNAANEYQAVYIAETPRNTDEKQQELSDRNQLMTETKRSVRKVILFYDDGSFEEFNK